MATVKPNILACIGNTPLVRLNSVTEGIRTPVYAKCEFMNPGGSVKDRIGLPILEAAEAAGAIRPGGTVVEATSGNTGVGLAVAAACKGYHCIFTLPDKMSSEKIRLLKAFGAEVVVTPTVPPDHPEYYVTVAKNIVHDTPNSYFANQFYNQVNPEAHYASTGPEIWAQTGGRIDVLVGGLGTGGTISGCGRYLKEKNPDLRVIGADPVGSLFKSFKETGVLGQGEVYKVEGIGNDKIPGTTWMEFIDEFRNVDDRSSFTMARRIAREEGMLVGGSSGTAVTVALEVARELDDPDKVVVVILPSTGERYLSKFLNDEWMRENRFLEGPATDVRQLLLQKPATARAVISAAGDLSLQKTLDLMARHNVSQLPIIENGESIGSVRESRLMALVLEKKATLNDRVGQYLDPPFPVIGANETVEYVSRLLGRDNAALLVRTGGEITGILTRYDVIKSMSE
ncbi:MAG: pyridoxal-phosphate dependent enzyme [Planctomycetes bacterium]|nr:pyridoxal-phosphate dependent enzyme [Planctomycetota bacterium]